MYETRTLSRLFGEWGFGLHQLTYHGIPMNSLYIFEGTDGVGKSTLVREISHCLAKLGVKNHTLSFPGREEGTLGAHVYKLHHEPEHYGISTMSALSRQILHVAAHVDSIERKILPLIEDGAIVLLDRYWWSTWAYGVEGGVSTSLLDAILEVEHQVWRGVVPATLFYVTRSQSKATAELCEAYETLIGRESLKHPIERVDNNGGLSETTEVLVKKLLIQLNER